MTLLRPVAELEAAGEAPTERRRGSDARVGRRWLLALLALVIGSVWVSGIGRTEILNPDGLTQVGDFFAAAFHPELDPQFLSITWQGALVTLSYAVLGTALSLVLGLTLGIAVSEIWATDRELGPGLRVARRVLRTALIPCRAVHEAVYAVLLVNILGINPLVAIIAIGIPFGAVTAKVFAQMLDDVPRHWTAVLRASGASRRHVLLFGVLPEALPNLSTYAWYRFECAIRAAAVLGVIGAGGLGFQIRVSFQGLEYGEMWTLLYALIALCGAADWWSSRLRRRRTTTAGPGGRTSGAPRRHLLRASLAIGALAIPLAWWNLGIDLSTLWAPRAIDNAQRLISLALPPVAPDGIWKLVALSVETLAMSVLASVLAFGAATGVALVAARAPRRMPSVAGARARSTAFAARLVLLVCRAIPPPVWALLFLFVCFPGIVPGALALAIYNFGVLGRLMAELMENLDPVPGAALRSSGASRVQVFAYDRVPRLATSFAALGLYRWEVAIRETVVVGLVAAGGLGFQLHQELAAFDYQAIAATLLALVAITALTDIVSTRLRAALR